MFKLKKTQDEDKQNIKHTTETKEMCYAYPGPEHNVGRMWHHTKWKICRDIIFDALYFIVKSGIG
jgi:hypothetical protein